MCGNTSLAYHKGQWCCPNSGEAEDCVIDGDSKETWNYGWPNHVTCKNGRPLKLTQQCVKKIESMPTDDEDLLLYEGSGLGDRENDPQDDSTQRCNHFPEDEYRNSWADRSYLDVCNDNR